MLVPYEHASPVKIPFHIVIEGRGPSNPNLPDPFLIQKTVTEISQVSMTHGIIPGDGEAELANMCRQLYAYLEKRQLTG